MRPLSKLASSLPAPVLAVVVSTVLAATSVLAGPAATAGAGPRNAGPRDESPFFSEANKPISVNGSYIPLVGDFGGSVNDDIIWYAPGPGADQLWISNGDGSFTKSLLSPQVGAAGMIPIVGHFAGVAQDDVLWYQPGTGADWLAVNTGHSAFTNVPVTINGTYSPVLLPNPVGRDSILWRGQTGASSVWSFTGSGAGHATHLVTTPVVGQPLVGDFNGDGHDDIFWYGPGSAPDALWRGNGAGGFNVTPESISGVYTPVVHDLTPGYDGKDDIFWDSPTGGASSLWMSRGDGTWTTLGTTVPKGTPVAADGTFGVVYIVRPGFPDWVWYDNPPSVSSQPSHDSEIAAGAIPLVGTFLGVRDNIFWYAPGATPEHLFYLNAIN